MIAPLLLKPEKEKKIYNHKKTHNETDFIVYFLTSEHTQKNNFEMGNAAYKSSIMPQ